VGHGARLAALAIAFSPILVLPTLASESLPSPATVADVAVHARGGRQKISSIQSEHITGQIDANGESGSFSLVLKRPGKIRMELNFGGKRIIEASDGKDAWQIDETTNLNKPSQMSKGEKDKFLIGADIDGPFLDYQSKGIKIEPLDVEMLGASQVWKVQVTNSAGTAFIYYIETSGGYTLMHELPIAKTAKDSETVREYYRDFRTVKGMPFPFVTISEANSGSVATLSVDRVDINSNEDDNLFTMSGFLEEKPASGTANKLP
jgi:outer membrane lipoprotein-sorting protein